MPRIPATMPARLRPASAPATNAEILISLIQGVRASRAIAFAMGEGAVSHAALSGALGAHLVTLASNTLGVGAAEAIRGALEHVPTVDDIEAARSAMSLLARSRSAPYRPE